MAQADDKQAWLTAYRNRSAALARVRALELAGMTEEQAQRIMNSLVVVDQPWRPRPDWSGLVEQQALFMRGSRR